MQIPQLILVGLEAIHLGGAESLHFKNFPNKDLEQ